MRKRSHGRTTKAPPDERGNRYVQPTATASHSDSTHHVGFTIWPTSAAGRTGHDRRCWRQRRASSPRAAARETGGYGICPRFRPRTQIEAPGWVGKFLRAFAASRHRLPRAEIFCQKRDFGPPKRLGSCQRERPRFRAAKANKIPCARPTRPRPAPLARRPNTPRAGDRTSSRSRLNMCTGARRNEPLPFRALRGTLRASRRPSKRVFTKTILRVGAARCRGPSGRGEFAHPRGW
jgi:hypothetical protein